MASGSDAVLEWHKQDKKRMLHAVYRVGDLDRAIKYVAVICNSILNIWVRQM